MPREIRSIVVTGPTGIVGTALIRECILRQVKVLAICRTNSPRRNVIPAHPLVTVLECDAQDFEKIPDTVGQYDAFAHFAWLGTKDGKKNDVDTQLQNIRMSLDAVRLAARLGCKVFMGSGSQAEYGRITTTLTPDTAAAPVNGYGIAKLCAGSMTRLLCGQLGLTHIWLRILSTYGPGDWSHTIIPTAIRSFSEGTDVAFTKGEQIWDLIYCEDEAKILFRLLESGKDGSIYCIGTDHAVTLAESIRTVYRIVTGHDASDEEIGIGKRPYGEQEVMCLKTDPQNYTKDIGEVTFTPFEEGIRKTAEWMKQHEMY